MYKHASNLFILIVLGPNRNRSFIVCVTNYHYPTSMISARLKSEGVEEVFVLCTRGEFNKYRVPSLLDDLKEAGMGVHTYPFPDGQTPSITSLMKMIETLRINLMQGHKSLIQ